MADLESMARALAFIEAHLQEPGGVGYIAQAASYSPYHFCRTFSRLTLHTPYDYLMRRRVAEAARALWQTDCKVIDVALAYQFNNPETFSRAFKRVLGQQPQQWRKQATLSPRQLMPPLTLAHLYHWQRCSPWQPTVEARAALCLVGVMLWQPEEFADSAPAWVWLRRELGEMHSGPFYGLTTYARAGAFDAVYLAAIAGDAALADGRALVTKALPASHWCRVTHRGPARDFGLTLDYLYHTWLPQSPYRLAWAGCLECYGILPGRSEDAQAAWEVAIPLESPDC